MWCLIVKIPDLCPISYFYIDIASTKGYATVFGTQWLMHTWPEGFQMFVIIVVAIPHVLAVGLTDMNAAFQCMV